MVKVSSQSRRAPWGQLQGGATQAMRDIIEKRERSRWSRADWASRPQPEGNRKAIQVEVDEYLEARQNLRGEVGRQLDSSHASTVGADEGMRSALHPRTPRPIIGAMKPSPRSRIGLGLLLLGFVLQSALPIALEPDHYLKHKASAQPSAEERASLRGRDGDHDHKGACLELGEKGSNEACDLCAQLGKSPALVLKRLGVVATLDTRSAALPEAACVTVRFGKGPYQPRAPPRV